MSVRAQGPGHRTRAERKAGGGSVCGAAVRSEHCVPANGKAVSPLEIYPVSADRGVSLATAPFVPYINKDATQSLDWAREPGKSYSILAW